MSLQVWLPLNGRANNQGLLGGDLPQSTTPTYVDGKLGKSMSSGGFYMTASQTSQILNNTALSICFWVYINAATGTTDNRVMLFGNDSRDANNNRKFSLFNYPTVNDFHWNWMNDTASTAFTSGVLSGVLPSYQWTHVCITYQNPNGVVYINGVQKETFSGVSNSSTFAYQTQVIRSSSYLRWNDFRIYDHCLSAKEVKEISKGLVCHYKLSGCGEYNIAKNTSTKLILTSKGGTNENTGSPTVSNFGGDPYELIGALPDLLTEDDYITFSYDWKVTTITDSGLSGNFKGGVNASPWECTGSIVLSDTNRSGRCVYTAKAGTMATSTATKVRFRMDNIPSGTVIEISNLKFEKSNSPTPWCPATSDTMYTTLGYDDNIEYDCSGYGNHGTKSGTITCSSDTPRYSGSYNFDVKGHYNIPNKLVSPNEFSCSFWVKPISCGKYAIISSNYNNPASGFWLAVNRGSSGLWFYNGGYATSNKGLLSMNTWYHACFVFKNGVITWYQNGESAGTTDLSGKTTTLGISGNISIGNSYTGTSWDTNYSGHISDFRLYATALSADDIKALYNTSASVDKSGNIYAYEFKEE